MRITIATIVLLVFALHLAADEIEDVGYIAYLYRMGETRAAMLKIEDFLDQYPDSEFAPDVLFLRAGVDLTEGRYERSRDTYAELLRANAHPSMRAQSALGLAQAHYFIGDVDESEAELRAFTQNDPEHPLNAKAWYFIGKIEQDRGEHETALKSFDTATKYGEDPALDVARVASLSRLGRDGQAESTITRLFDQGQTEAAEEALLLYHDANLREGSAQRVLDFQLDRVPPTSPWYGDYIELVAQANYELGHYEEAARRIERLDNPSDKSRYTKALSLLALHRDEEASTIFRQLYESSQERDIAVNSYFYLARLTARDDPAQGNAMLQGFLSEHDSHPLCGAAAYQLAMNHFESGEYGAAAQRFEQALSLQLEPANAEKARYLLGESHFLAGGRQQAENAFNTYLQKHAAGRFADEAQFKLGVINFETKRYDRAEDRFNRVISDFPESPKTGMAEFYLGEIAFFDGRYTFALQHYHRALKGVCDQGYTQERIARIHFQNKDYAAALRAIDAIPETDRYAYDKHLLEGDVRFAAKEYAPALLAYQQAEKAATADEQREAVRSRLAWTYYQRGDYDRASQIYSELTVSSSSPETFLMLAAQAAFSADDYLTAIQYYRQYIQQYSRGADYNKALLGLADSYYNLGSYNKAVDYYRPLVRTGVPSGILENALNGLVWSARQSEEIDLPAELDRLLAQSGGSELTPMVLERKANWLLEQKRYDEAVMECNRIVRDYPTYERRMAVYTLQAQCYRAQGKQALAESVYQQMFDVSGGDDPDVLYDWAQVKLTAVDTLGAIEKLAAAADLTRSSRIWLALLQTQLASGDEGFLERYQSFSRFADDREMAEAQLLWVDWQVRRRQFGLVGPVLSSLLQSDWKDIRSMAQYWTGRVLYERKEYEQAVAELLRVRYLFPEAVHTQLLAEYYACLAWIEMGEHDKARDRFAVIREGLSATQEKTIENRLGGE